VRLSLAGLPSLV